jgi:TPR repeat protein
MFWLGWVLQSHISMDESMKPAAKTLQVTAALLEDENASLILVESALRAERLHHPDLQAAERTLVRMSDQGHVHATERLAALYERRGEQAKALRLAEKIMTEGVSRDSQEAHILSPQFNCWKIVSRIRREQNDLEGELEAIEYGAKVMDDPEAYCELAMKNTTLDARRRLEYLLKAAASGVGHAAYLVGDYYYGQATGRALDAVLGSRKLVLDELKKDGSIFDHFQLNLAGNWFQVALEAKAGPLSYDRDAAGIAAVVSLAEAGDVETACSLLRQYSGMQFAERFRSL